MIVIKEGRKVDRIKLSGCTNGVLNFLLHYGQNFVNLKKQKTMKEFAEQAGQNL